MCYAFETARIIVAYSNARCRAGGRRLQLTNGSSINVVDVDDGCHFVPLDVALLGSGLELGPI